MGLLRQCKNINQIEKNSGSLKTSHHMIRQIHKQMASLYVPHLERNLIIILGRN